MTKRTAVIILGSLLGMAGSAGADEPGTVTGRVVDDGDRPIARAAVALEPTESTRAGAAGASGPDGRFELEVPPGRYVLVVTAGPTTIRQTLDVQADAHLETTVRLQGRVEVVNIREKAPGGKAQPPRPLKRPDRINLPYTDEAILSDQWARGWVLLEIDADGRVTDVDLLVRPGLGLDAVAVREARKLRFAPARDRAGRAVPAFVVWPMDWPSYWWARTEERPRGTTCRGSGPLELDMAHPVYVDCRRPDPRVIDAAMRRHQARRAPRSP